MLNYDCIEHIARFLQYQENTIDNFVSIFNIQDIKINKKIHEKKFKNVLDEFQRFSYYNKYFSEELCQYMNIDFTNFCYTEKIMKFAKYIDNFISICKTPTSFDAFFEDDFYNNIDEKSKFYLYIICLYQWNYDDNTD